MENDHFHYVENFKYTRRLAFIIGTFIPLKVQTTVNALHLFYDRKSVAEYNYAMEYETVHDM